MSEGMRTTTLFLAWAAFRNREGFEIVMPIWARASHPEIAYQFALRNAKGMLWHGAFLGLCEFQEAPTSDETDESMLERPVLPHSIPTKDALLVRMDKKWNSRRPSAEQVEAALAEPPVLFDIPGLSDVKWDALRHSYGTASNIPDHLRGLASVEHQWRDSSLQMLLGLLDHQSESGQVMAACIPFLLWLLANWPPHIEQREELAEALHYEADSADVRDIDQIQTKWETRSKLLRGGIAVAEMVMVEIENRVAVARAFLNAREVLRRLEHDENPVVAEAIRGIQKIIESGFALAARAS